MGGGAGSCALGKRAHGALSLSSAPPKCCSRAYAWLKKNQAALWHRLLVGVLKEDDMGSKHPDPTLAALCPNRDPRPPVALHWHKLGISLDTRGAGLGHSGM